MINSKKDYQEYIRADRYALGFDKRLPKYGGGKYRIYKYQKLLRKLEYYNNCKKSNIYKPYFYYLKLRFRRLSIKYGFEIPINCIGKGLSIAHFGTIVINGATKIGENCRLHVDVNIGTQAGYTDRAPVLGNNIYIGPGAKIFGDINIADGIAIGANAVVNKSFNECNISIGGVPAKKISNKGTIQLKNNI